MSVLSVWFARSENLSPTRFHALFVDEDGPFGGERGKSGDKRRENSRLADVGNDGVSGVHGHVGRGSESGWIERERERVRGRGTKRKSFGTARSECRSPPSPAAPPLFSQTGSLGILGPDPPSPIVERSLTLPRAEHALIDLLLARPTLARSTDDDHDATTTSPKWAWIEHGPTPVRVSPPRSCVRPLL